MNGIVFALLGTLFTFSVTALGACNVFWMKRNVTGDVQCIFLGFAGGVMIAASVWSLLIPAIERANTKGQISWLVVSIGFLLGVLVLLVADKLVKRRWETRERREHLSLKSHTEMLILAITIHNIPEGMAVGLAFALAAENPADSNLLSGAIALAVVQELIPEAHLGEKENVGTLGFIVGFLIMMILDVALG